MAALKPRLRRVRRALALALSLGERGLRSAGRAALALLRDSDTYVLAGIGLLAAGVGMLAGAGAGLLAAGVTLFGFGLWLGYWRLSAVRPRERDE